MKKVVYFYDQGKYKKYNVTKQKDGYLLNDKFISKISFKQLKKAKIIITKAPKNAEFIFID